MPKFTVEVSILKCIFTNCESIRNKIEEFQHVVQNTKPDIIHLAETWCQPQNFLDSELKNGLLKNYHMVRKDNTREARGGLITYIHKTLNVMNCSELDDLHTDFSECLFNWIKKDEGPKILTGCIYRKGNSSQENDILLHQILERVGNQGYGVLLTGDFNLPNIDWDTQTITAPENSPEQQFLDALNDSFLTQHVKEITRVRGDHRLTSLDLIITNDQNSVENMLLESTRKE